MALNEIEVMIAKAIFPQKPADTEEQLEIDFAHQMDSETARVASNALRRKIMEENPKADFAKVSTAITKLYSNFLASMPQAE